MMKFKHSSLHSLFPTLQTVSLIPVERPQLHPTITVYLPPHIMELVLDIHNEDDATFFTGLDQITPNLKTFKLQGRSQLPAYSVVKTLLPTIISLVSLTRLEIGHDEKSMIVDLETLLALSKQTALTHCHVEFYDKPSTSDLEGISTKFHQAFPSLESFGIVIDNSDNMSYSFIGEIIQSISSPALRRIQINFRKLLPVDLITHLLNSMLSHNIQTLSINYTGRGMLSAERAYRQGFLEPNIVEQMFRLQNLRALHLIGLSTSWRASLVHKMASAWPALEEVIIWHPYHGETCSNLNRPSETYIDIRELIHFAEGCPNLRKINIPYRSMFEAEVDIPLHFKIGTSRSSIIFIDDRGTFTLNNLATATFLYYLFGRKIESRHHEFGHNTLSQALEHLYDYIPEDGDIPLDYHNWIAGCYQTYQYRFLDWEYTED